MKDREEASQASKRRGEEVRPDDYFRAAFFHIVLRTLLLHTCAAV